MKTLEINTGIGTVVLTYSESFKKWDFFSGNQEAMKHLEQAAEDMGWVYDPKKRNFITNFIAENAEKFVSKSEEKEASELWDNEKEDVKTREFQDEVSNLGVLKSKNYKKIVHVNGEKAALFFYVKEKSGRWVPFTGTSYKSCGIGEIDKLPNFIKRHLNLDIMQDYINCRMVGNYSKYPNGLHFENQELVKL